MRIWVDLMQFVAVQVIESGVSVCVCVCVCVCVFVCVYKLKVLCINTLLVNLEELEVFLRVKAWFQFSYE